MKGLEILCPHCNKKVVIPEYILAEVLDKYQKSKAQEKPPQPEVEEQEPEVIEKPQVIQVADDLEGELKIREGQLAEIKSRLEKNQSNLSKVMKARVKDDDMFQIQKERSMLLQELKKLQQEIAIINNRLGRPKKNQML